MKSKIRVLTEHTINKIAAGEVIENPSSVVKELVENSLDAGATDICVEIKGGGRQLIRITDNGHGMGPDDALLCLERHATSKIREVEDLLTLHSMGFRGEALPSIASISKFILLTCPNPPSTPEDMGAMVMVDGGKILRCSPAACSPGTTIEVKALFFNVPVRKNFQKSPAYDANEIHKMLSLLALGHPDIKFQLISNEKILLSTPSPKSDSSQNLNDERISAILGSDFFEELRPVEAQKGVYSLKGFAGVPGSHRQNRTGQYLFINKRAVYSPLVSYAVREGYGPSIPSNRHPIFILHLTLPGPLVDVNVHPQKKEVRLRQENLFKDMIVQAIEKTLHTRGSEPPTIIDLPSLAFSSHPWEFNPAPRTFDPPSTPLPLFPSSPPENRKINPPPHATPPMWLERKKEEEKNEPTLFQPLNPTLPIPKVIATLPRYIIVESSSLDFFKGEGLCLIDSHGAHARIIYEKLDPLKKNDGSSQNLASQLLLIPYTFDTTPTEAHVLKEQLPSLNALGISIKEFGVNSFSVDAIPQCFGNVDMQELLKDILHQLNDRDKKDWDIERRRKLAIAASRTAVSKNKRLSLEEAQGLLKQLMQCQIPFQCPQGRSILAKISPEELARYFKS